MRRKRISSGNCRSLRAGVTASVATIKIRIQSPVWCVMYSMGFAVRLWFSVRQPNWPSGHMHRPNAASLLHLLLRTFGKTPPGLEILLQVHTRIERGDLVIAVEHQRVSS